MSARTLIDCRKCGAFSVWQETHECPPIFAVWCLDYDQTEDDARRVHARTHEIAAEKWAERDDADGDYTIVRGTKVVVMVRKEGEETPKALMVEGESVPNYNACDATPCGICGKLTPIPDAVRRVGDVRDWVHRACAKAEPTP